jgi:hypothetical protein
MRCVYYNLLEQIQENEAPDEEETVGVSAAWAAPVSDLSTCTFCTRNQV